MGKRKTKSTEVVDSPQTVTLQLPPSAPRCIACGSECPNGFIGHHHLVICQNPKCSHQGIFQVGAQMMNELNNRFPYKDLWETQQ